MPFIPGIDVGDVGGTDLLGISTGGRAYKSQSIGSALGDILQRLKGISKGKVTAAEARQIAREAQTYPGNAAAPARPVAPRPDRIVGPKPGPITVTRVAPISPIEKLAARKNSSLDTWNALKQALPPVKRPSISAAPTEEEIQNIISRGRRIQTGIAADITNPVQRSSGFPRIDLKSAQAKAPIPKADVSKANLQYGIEEAYKQEEMLPGVFRSREEQALQEFQNKQRADLAADAEQKQIEAAARQNWIEAKLSQIRADVTRIQKGMGQHTITSKYPEQVTEDYKTQRDIGREVEARVKTGIKESDAAEQARVAGQQPTIATVKTKAIEGGNAGKGTPLGDAKDIAMRSESDAAIVELAEGTRSVRVADPNAVGKSSSETSLLRLGSPKGDLNGKVIMLARNGALKNQPLRKDTVNAIINASKRGASFVVGDMPGVDSQFVQLLNKIKANYTVYHTGSAPRFTVRVQGR